MSERVEAGREMDAEVAEKVFGMSWRVGLRTDGRILRMLLPPHAMDDTSPADDTVERDPDYWDSWVDHYSTDRAAALDVMDRLTDADLQVTISANNWMVSVEVDNIEGEHLAHAVCGYDEPAEVPLAICRAALSESVLSHLRAMSEREQFNLKGDTR